MEGDIRVPVKPKTIEVKVKQEVGAVDRISMLPDELLVLVLCSLNSKEATATSVLSRSWRHLHTLTNKLDFDGFKYSATEMELEEKSRKLVRGINGLVRMNQSSNDLEEFRVVFGLLRHHTQHINNWIRFALSRRVKSLELNFYSTRPARNKDYYILKLQKFNNNQYHNLRKFSTYCVNVNGEGLEMLLRNCPLLEELSVGVSAHLVNLYIQKPLPAFKRLVLSWCWKLNLVVVRDSNIESIVYIGDDTVDWWLVNVPYLNELWVGGWCTQRAVAMVQMFCSLLPQLHTLNIIFMRHACLQGYSFLKGFCSEFRLAVKNLEMSNLKQLMVITEGVEVLLEDSLLPLIHLINASPRLVKFVIHEPACENTGWFVKEEMIPMERKVPVGYPQLKEVEFVDYRGVSSHRKILEYFVEYAIALETIVIHPWRNKDCKDPIERQIYNNKIVARAEAFKQRCAHLGVNVWITVPADTS